MKTNTTLFLGLMLSVSVVALGDRPIKPPVERNLVGHWVGFCDQRLYFYRLNLRGDNTGKLVVVYAEDEPDIYSVRWQLNERQLQLNLFPLTTNAEIMTCYVAKIESRRLDIEFAGVGKDWKRTASLLNEKALAAGIVESAKHESKVLPSEKKGDSNNR